MFQASKIEGEMVQLFCNVFQIIVLSGGHIGQMLYKTPGCRINHMANNMVYRFYLWHEHTKAILLHENLPVDSSINKKNAPYK